MKQRVRVVAAWAAAGVVVAGCVGAWRVAAPTPATGDVAPRPTIASMKPASMRDPAKAAVALRDRDPFRVDRRPTDVRYNPWEPAGPVAPPPARAPRPALSIGGIVGGPPWNALVQGIPGREGGALLSVGDTISGIRVVRITRDTVYLSGLDTTWALTQRRTWQ